MTINVPYGKVLLFQFGGLKQDGTSPATISEGQMSIDDPVSAYVAVAVNNNVFGLKLAAVPKPGANIPVGGTKTVNLRITGVKDSSSGAVLPDFTMPIVFDGAPPPPQIAFSVAVDVPGVSFGDIGQAPPDPGPVLDLANLPQR